MTDVLEFQGLDVLRIRHGCKITIGRLHPEEDAHEACMEIRIDGGMSLLVGCGQLRAIADKLDTLKKEDWKRLPDAPAVAASPWINANQKSPPNSDFVLGCDIDTDEMFTCYHYNDQWYEGPIPSPPITVTHWQPLLALPTKP